MKKALALLAACTTLYGCYVTEELPESRSESVYEPVNDHWAAYQADPYFVEYLKPLLDKHSKAEKVFLQMIENEKFSREGLTDFVCYKNFSPENINLFEKKLKNNKIKYSRINSNCECVKNYLKDKQIYKSNKEIIFEKTTDKNSVKTKTTLQMTFRYSEEDASAAIDCITDAKYRKYGFHYTLSYYVIQ